MMQLCVFCVESDKGSRWTSAAALIPADLKWFQSPAGLVSSQLSTQFKVDSSMQAADDEVVQELWASHPFFKTGQGHL